MPSRPRRFSQVDVFTDTPLEGNPVAVVHEADGLDTATMQRFTDWTNLSEATFLLPPSHPQADYAVRIFSPGQELPFAGHPTLGSCHAWLAAGGRPRGEHIVQECGVGLVAIHRDPDTGVLAFTAPPRRRSGPLDDADVHAIADGLGLRRDAVIAHQWCDNGPRWQAVLLASAEQVLAVRPDPAGLAGRFVGLVGPHGPDGPGDVEVRAFFPGGQSLVEDPVTGSLNAALAQWLIAAGHLPTRYLAVQGTGLGRAGRVHIEARGDEVLVGGACVTVLEGHAVL